jgi:hypothetical protein
LSRRRIGLLFRSVEASRLVLFIVRTISKSFGSMDGVKLLFVVEERTMCDDLRCSMAYIYKHQEIVSETSYATIFIQSSRRSRRLVASNFDCLPDQPPKLRQCGQFFSSIKKVYRLYGNILQKAR